MSRQFKNIWGVSRKTFKRHAIKNYNVCESKTEIDEFQHSCEVDATIISCSASDNSIDSDFLDSHLNLHVSNFLDV